MNQFRLLYIYIWKCHKEAPCVATLNKQKFFFSFFYKIGEQKGEPVPAWGIWYQWERGGGKERA
jgi:hypothetical protein